MKKLFSFFALTLLLTSTAEAGRMKEIYTMTNESVEFELDLFQEDGLILITAHKFTHAEKDSGLAVETKVVINNNGKVLYTCVTQFEKTERFFRDYKTICK